MTDTEINIAMAELCDWTWILESAPSDFMALRNSCGELVHTSNGRVDDYPLHMIPDYANNLNAMHEAESTLSFADQRRYGRTLGEVLDDCIGSPDHDWHATARQRAEAFIRTFGTWKEGM
jgi:hypothetical protein